MTMQRNALAVVLAAGEGTRMKSSRAKVTHRLAGLPLVGHVVAAVAAAGIRDVALVTGRDGEAVLAAAHAGDVALEAFVQHRRLGTGHAVLAARKAIERGYDDILVMFGDAPLVRPDTLVRAQAELASGSDVAVIGFRAANPSGYGRLVERDGMLAAIREEKDASEDERSITLCNGGLMAIAGHKALSLLDAIGNDNAKGEFYLTDIVEIAVANGGRVTVVEADADELIGVNTRVELAEAEAVWQKRRRRDLMLAGVSMSDPQTVYLAHDTVIEADAMIEPNVYFGPGVTVGEGAIVHAFSHIEGATVGAGAQVGPFARLRPGALLKARSKVGNFCEVKKAEIGEGAKINHLTYIGDAVIGARVNVGAGTITCNYDGINKHLTEIGEDSFIGSNTSLVAPVKVGQKAYIASGSVITDAVPDDAVAFARERQVNKEGRAHTLRERNEAFRMKKAEAKD